MNQKLPGTKTSLEVEKTKIQSLEEELSNINLGKKIGIWLKDYWTVNLAISWSCTVNTRTVNRGTAYGIVNFPPGCLKDTML